MAQALSSTFLIFFFLCSFSSIAKLVISTPQQNQCNNSPNQSIKAGFFFSNSNHYAPISSINPFLYTHLYYVSISSNDSYLSTFSQAVKFKNPSLKTLLCLTPNTSSAFVENDNILNSTIQNAVANGFDGIDLVLQYPKSRSEITNFAFLIKSLRARLNGKSESTPVLLLTATVYFSNHIFDGPSDGLDYPTSIMSSGLDWINVASFGFHDATNVTAFDAPLYDKSSHFSASYGIISWLDAGFSPCQVIMGLPLYGRSHILKNKSKNVLGALVVADGPKQRASNRTGFMAFFEMEELLLRNKDAEFEYDNASVATYFCLGDLWVSFDGVDVVKEKIKFASRYRLRGFFLWPINYDNPSYTISTLASNAWDDSFGSLYSEKGNNGLKQAAAAAAPFELPPLENASVPNTANGISKPVQPWIVIFGCILILNRMAPVLL